MLNDVRLQEGHPVDENLRPIRVGGKSTAIETAQHGNGARVNGDLEVTGGIPTVKTNSIVSADLTIDDSGDITLDPGGHDIFLKYAGLDGGKIYTSAGLTKLMGVATNHSIEIETSGTGDVILDSHGDIDISSDVGGFIMRKGATEFSAANSAYAGMILGYTDMVYGTTFGRYDTTTSFVVINGNYDHGDGAEDHFLGVTFVVPPSNRVELEVVLPYLSGADGTLHLGLATATDATTLKTKFEVVVWDVDETDLIQIVQRWVIEGTDSGMQGGAWSAGESKTIYCTIKEGTAGCRLFWGDGFINYGDMTMKATALPATIGDGT